MFDPEVLTGVESCCFHGVFLRIRGRGCARSGTSTACRWIVTAWGRRPQCGSRGGCDCHGPCHSAGVVSACGATAPARRPASAAPPSAPSAAAPGLRVVARLVQVAAVEPQVLHAASASTCCAVRLPRARDPWACPSRGPSTCRPCRPPPGEIRSADPAVHRAVAGGVDDQVGRQFACRR